MLLVSAYSPNRDMNVFESSVSWLSVSLVASCINYIFYSVFSRLPNLARHASLMFAGFSFVLFSYLSLYLLPLIGIGMVGLIVFGISIHMFVPAMFTVNTIYLIKRAAAIEKNSWRSFLIGG